MKKLFLIGIIIGIAGLVWLGRSAWFSETVVSNAQTSDVEYQKLLDRDKNVPKEKVEKAFAEAKKIQDDILAIIAEKKPELKFFRKYSSHLSAGNPGRRGVTLDDLSWRTKKTKLHIQVHLDLNEKDVLASFREGLEHISMGDFFDVPNFGNDAVLVKNVLFNTKMTNVGLHFVKGRAKVNIYVTNHKRKTVENEKELMEIARLIEPLIIARKNFDE